MEEQINKVVEGTDKPFGVNVRVARMQMDHKVLLRNLLKWRKQNPKIREQLVYVLTSAGGARDAAKMLSKDPDVSHFHVAPALWLVDKIVDVGCHICATGTEGGGHQSYEKVTTLVLLQEVCQKYPDKMKVACGGIANPEGVAAALAMGADAVAMGTRFIASNQSEFHPNYKNLLPPAADRDTLVTTGGFGPIRLLKNKYCMEHGSVVSKEEKIAQELETDMDKWLEDLHKYEIVYTEGDVENGAIPVGQSCGVIKELMDVDDIVSGYSKKAEVLLKSLVSRIS
jgi:enoyl-[acyl-carrier protein] reductase II